ncbi:MAG TPA: AAA family ATPase, partial [Nitrosomonas europaea]|nr:AAA family ATPase [Nitrosomonas europaea]
MNDIATHSVGARLEFSNIRKSFGNTVSVEADNLTIEPGSLTVLLGRSGCGKTTLLNLAAGLAEKGRRVLLIDLDAQGSASLSLGIPRADLRPGTAE